MHRLNIKKSVLSITSPGVHLQEGDDAGALKLARECNDFAADLKHRHLQRFGFWATIPLPSVQDSIEEATRALDVLGADGITILTNSHSHYLGNAQYQPLWQALNQRNAIVFIHPTTPCIHHEASGPSAQAAPLAHHYPNPMFEFLFDTARSVIDLFLTGTIRRHPNITWLVSHAGGTLPVLVERFTSVPPLLSMRMGGETPESIKTALREKFYFDLAGMPYPASIKALLEYTTVKRVTYGSDYPFTPAGGAANLAEQMDGWVSKIWQPEEIDLAMCKNAEGLLLRGRRTFNRL